MIPDWAKLKPVNSIRTNTTLGAPIYPQSEVIVTPCGQVINANFRYLPTPPKGQSDGTRSK